MEKSIPILDNQGFLRRFGDENAFFSTINIERIVIVPLELSWNGLRWDFPFPAVRSTSHDFILVTQGTTERQRGIDIFHTNAGKMLFLPAFQISRVLNMSPDIRGYFVNFSDAFLSEMTGQPHPLSPFRYWRPDAPALWDIDLAVLPQCEAALQALYSVTQQNHPERESIAAHQLLAFFFFIKPYLQAVENRPVSDNAPGQLANRFKQLLSHAFDPQKSIADYAALLHVSPNHLNKSVRTAMGKTSSALLDEHRLLEAKVMLLERNLTLGMVAEHLGFADQTHFGRFFKKNTGQTPSEFKKRIEKAE